MANRNLLIMTSHLRLKRISEPKHTRLKFGLEKLRVPTVLTTFKAVLGGKFSSLTIMNSKDADMDSMNTTAVTETVSEILGKHRQKKKPRITAAILDLCNKWIEWRTKIFKAGESEKIQESERRHQEVHGNNKINE